MATGRITGPLGDISGLKITHSAATLNWTPPPKPIPKGVDSCILYPPPGLYQRECYKGEEGLFGCWATTAEMIVKHRSSAAKFVRPSFQKELPSGPAGSDALFQSQVRYMDFVDAQLKGWGFRPLPGAMTYPWDLGTLASWLQTRGPLLFDGDFFQTPQGGVLIHCVVVFGAQDDIVYYRDPGDDNRDVKRMSMTSLVAKARPKGKTPWALGNDRFDISMLKT